jgi:hypothetical protein
MYLHQIFMDIGQGKTYRDNPIYKKCYDKNKVFLKKTTFNIKIWNEKDLDYLVKEHYPKYLTLWNSFPNPFYKIDFVRPLILHYEGGVYMDMDNILTTIPDINREYILANWENEIASDLIYFQDKKIYLKFADFMLERSKKCKMPNNWKVRRLQYCVGQKCFNQFCKLHKYLDTVDIYKSFYTATWLTAFNKKINR